VERIVRKANCGQKCALALLLLSTFVSWASSAQVAPSSTQINIRKERVRAEAWFARGRTMPASSGARLRYQAHEQKLRMRAARQPTVEKNLLSQQSSSGWSSLGPAPLASDASGLGQQDYGWVSGRATAVAIDPADPTANTVYIGGAYGGVWKSSNAASPNPEAVNWPPLTDDQATLAVGAIAVQSQLSDPNPENTVVLVGTGEANSSTDSYYGLGILRSTDAGQSWSLIQSDSSGSHSFAGLAFSKIAFSTANPNLAVAAVAGSSEGILEGLANPITANLGIYFSTDAGDSWNYANVQDGTVATAPGSVSTVVYDATAGQFFAAVRYHGFYSSPDGANWTRLANQPGTRLTASACPAQSSSMMCPIYRGEIAVVPGRNEMYVWFVDVNDNDQGIWETTNGGSTWIPINDSGITNCGDDLGCATEDGTYNLELAAVPDGGATDLYAGAINLYKCQINGVVPDCSGTTLNTFLNLTHAYGCSSIAKVHPAQHSISFLLNNDTQDVMYFANDGGIYRSLDGFAGLTTGACSGSNQFDNLNQTLGPITQFISFSQSPGNNGYPILGGTQGNGSPATESALADTPWLNVAAGDSGYNQINPSNPNEWFVSTPPDAASGVNIFRCESGINCHTKDFQNDQVVSSATLEGDTGAYYPPYLLDPQSSGELIVGTCRIWRGSSSGTGFTALSNSFETGGAGSCTGSETNLVRSLTAGGPVDTNGFSNVIYAGTDGFGPLIPTIPSGGHVWVSTNAWSGTSTWVDQTGSLNPSAFPISDVALDSSDASGMTAYVTIMGFHVSHIWKTLNGGAMWTDFTGNLPDATANALLVDSSTSPSVVYVGTDVGVFTSSSLSPSWSEPGPPYLPDVAVTALRVFSDERDKWLRASTYGRGVWQFPIITTPDFLSAVSNTPLTVFAGSQGVFQGLITSLDGYASSVNLSCSAGLTAAPSTCSLNPTQITPSSSGSAFTITTAGTAGVYTFNLHAVGTDSNTTTHDAAVTFNVVDFNLTAPSVSSITMEPGTTSAPIGFQVTASGPFAGTVTLSCAGLPAGTACNFQPSASVSPSASSPASISLTIMTGTNTTAGKFPVTIVGSVANGPSKTRNLLLTVTSDYSLVIANPWLSASQNATAVFQGTVTSLNGYSSLVDLSCGSGAPPTCNAVPQSLTPAANGASFTVKVSSNKIQTYNFIISGVGTDPSSVTHTVAVSFISTTPNANFTFSIIPNSQSASIAAGETATYKMTLSPCTLCGAFPSAVSLSFAGCPPLSTCSLSQTSVAAGSGATNLSLNVQTSAAIAASASVALSKWPIYLFWLYLPGLIFVAQDRQSGWWHPRKRGISLLCLTSIITAISLIASCGGGLQGGSTASGNPGTPPGSYFMTVTATMNASPSTPAQTADLTLTVQ